MIYLTSDWHFNHNRDFIWAPRGFNSVYEMNDAIIKRHNEIVEPEDTVYVLGDLCLGGGSYEALKSSKDMIQSLKGNIKVILGNHDTGNRINMYHDCKNVEVIGYSDMIKFNGYHFYLSHYPTITSNLDYDKPLKRRLLNIFGHTHSIDKFYEENPMMYNVAQDAHNCYPVPINQIIHEMEIKFKSTSNKDRHKLDITPYENFLERYIKERGGDYDKDKRRINERI